MSSKYNIWNKWDPLESVMLGSSYTADFFSDMKDQRVKSSLQRIADETAEDLEAYEQVLKDFGCEVIRPKIDPKYRIGDYLEDHSYHGSIPRAPLQPRDHHMVLGDIGVITPGAHPAINEALRAYDSDNTYDIIKDNVWPEYVFDILKSQYSTEKWPTYQQYATRWKGGAGWERTLSDEFKKEMSEIRHDFEFPLGSANTFPIGNRLYANTQYFTTDANLDRAKKSGWLKNFDVFWHNYDGHADGNFHPVKPGAIISLEMVDKYEESFPGWDVLYLPDQSWAKVDGFLQLKDKVNGKWWIPGEEQNDRLTHFVETWLNEWVGYVEETVFDVNVLMLDEHHCCVSNPNNEEINAFFKKHKIEPVYVPWRHRYFWDGGLHCITLDLKRKGKQQNYF